MYLPLRLSLSKRSSLASNLVVENPVSQSNHLSTIVLTRFCPPRQKMYHTAALAENNLTLSAAINVILLMSGTTSTSIGTFWNSAASKTLRPEIFLRLVINFILMLKPWGTEILQTFSRQQTLESFIRRCQVRINVKHLYATKQLKKANIWK